MTGSIEAQIVAAPCRDGRADVQSLAKKTDTVATTVQRHLRALEADCVVEGYAARLDYGRLGFKTATFRLTVDLGAVEAVTRRLRDRREFVSVYGTTGEFNVHAVGKFGSAAAVVDCLHGMHADPEVDAMETSVVARVVRQGDSPLTGE